MYYKDAPFNNLAKFLNLGELESIQDAYIKNSEIKSSKENKSLEFTIVFTRIPLASDFFKLYNAINNYSAIKLIASYEINSFYIEHSEISFYIQKSIENEPKYLEIYDLMLVINGLYFNNVKKCWVFRHNNKEIDQDLVNQALEHITKQMNYFGFRNFTIDSEYQEPVKVSQNFEVDYSHFKKQLSMAVNNDFKSKVNNIRGKTFNRGGKNYNVNTIQEINNLDNLIGRYFTNFKGMVYRKEIIDRKDYFLYKYSVTDFKDAIRITMFTKEKLANEDDININEFGDFYGEVSIGTDFQKIVKIDKMYKTDSMFEARHDDAEVKRIELNAKSKMNTMDGLLDPADIINIAKQFNQPAVALLDSNSVQGFPEFFFSAKKANIKPIYGVSFDVIHNDNQVILNDDWQDITLTKAEYAVFDIETTGLSPRFSEIIEFGASIIKNGQIVENHQFFIKASSPLSSFTTNLTNITDKMLDEQGLEVDEALDKIYAILNNRIAVAHNANFDMNFVIQKFIQANKPLPKTTYLDSLAISRLLFENKAKHTLGEFCKNLEVAYDSLVAHRADYDAEVLAKAFLNAIRMLESDKILTLEQLSKLMTENYYQKIRSSQISILALNQLGLKELFKYVSLTLTKRFYKSPKMFYEDIHKTDNVLIGSGGLKGPLIDALLFSSDLEIDKLIDQFDYIEVPHPQALAHWISNDDFSLEQIQELLKTLIIKAKKKNKIVVAIGDVRYENKVDQIFFKSLVYSKGIGNTSHFLFNYSKAASHSLKLPHLHYLTTNEMKEQFAFLNDLDLINEIVVNNPKKIADLVDDNIEIIKKDLYTPKFDNSKEKLYDLVYKNAHKIYGEKLPEIVEERIKKEITPIIKYGFDVIYWISHKLVKKSIDNGYLVGSRGSVGSSLVATLSGITEINPLPPHYICSKCKYFELYDGDDISSGFDLNDLNCPNCDIKMIKDGQNIPFETFLGFNADKVPDIDLNFSGDYQSEIHDEVKRLFGEDHTLRAGTISTIKSKTSYGYVKKASEDYNFGYSPSFVDFISTKLEGVKRTTGQHPGGIIIIPKEFESEDFTPINYPADDISLDWKTTHFAFSSIHDNVLKLDILGHVDPTAIRMLEKLTGLDVKKDVPKKDVKVMSLFSSTNVLGITPEQIGGEITGALGIPEFGTGFVRRMLHEAQPKSFADLISLSGLSHGEDVWTNNAQELINKHNMTLKDVISCRDDIMVYLIHKGVDPLFSFKIMEQVRKGKGLSKEEEKQLLDSNIPSWYINSMKKIKYMFPKAHATAYVLMAWRIAWFKLYYPLEYYATYLTTRVDEFDVEILMNDIGCKKINSKLVELNTISDKKAKDSALIQTLEIARELYARGFSISNINLGKSLAKEWVIDYEFKSLIPPFSAIKGLGEAVANKIVASRDERAYMSQSDFQKRSGVNVTLFKVIKELGIIDHLNETDQMTLF
ncbi:PolC-type DNA polymerase III [Mycoplasma sp. NEAQ87857]|uniref:PolC-type DNA polymerase III n=1 Tax=Mycoplasma sp. NEAQ87857 TaxID=2683967 RepID=UPI001315DCBF|nr:PolC-type DNA polymerase III [Mycoplasma sp. NEAQ87857]QGZ97963.1 PolC-type DNA polymerase III [Mycoplasma sp. NEAQ87857]